nr:group III truncated hemoglobin [uncultured Rhodopila sp.]
MTQTETGSPGHPPHTGPTLGILPRADDPAPIFAGFAFTTGERPPHDPGVFILTRRLADRLYPVLIGEAENVAAAIIDHRAKDPAGADAADGVFWMPRAQPRQRTHIARDLIGKYHPPLNTEHRKAPAAPELAALIPDRVDVDSGTAPPPVGSITATEEELARLVEVFYAAAKADPLIGPVFNGTVADWDAHARTVANFWSRSMLGTTRYNGHPFTPHLRLGLTPDHFDRWVALFRTSATAVLQPEAAAYAIGKVEHMSTCFQTGLFLPPIEARAATNAAE